MKKLLLIGALVLAASTAEAAPSQGQGYVRSKLTGVGMPPEQAAELGEFVANAPILGAPAYVPTLAATPAVNTNSFQPGLNVVPTNAANNAAFIGPATPIVGQCFTIVNNAGAAIRAKAAGGATLNGATAGGYISIASLATVVCCTASATNQICQQPVIPTPAGP